MADRRSHRHRDDSESYRRTERDRTKKDDNDSSRTKRERSRSPRRRRSPRHEERHHHRRRSSSSPDRRSRHYEHKRDNEQRKERAEENTREERIDRNSDNKRGERRERRLDTSREEKIDRNSDDKSGERRERRLDTSREERIDRNSDDKRGERRERRLDTSRDVSHSEEDTETSRPSTEQTEEATKEKVEANFALSGKLAAETNTLNDVLIKYSEPREARVPKTRWRLYQFKGDEVLDTLYVHRQSAYLVGRDRKVVDFPIDNPSCSKQHAVLQYRLMDFVKEDGRKGRKVKPYIIDLGSTNGTYVNNQRIDSTRYVELKEKDMLKFGFSTREYVLLHENSKDSDDEGDSNPDM